MEDERKMRETIRVRWQDKITNEEVRRRCGVENLEHRLKKMRLRWFGHVKRVKLRTLRKEDENC